MEFLATNPANAREGDTVLLDFSSGKMLQLSLLLYIFPIMVLVIGAIIGDSWGASTGRDPSATAALFGFTGFLVAMGSLLLLERRAKRSDRYKPVIVQIKKRGTPNSDGVKCESCH